MKWWIVAAGVVLSCAIGIALFRTLASGTPVETAQVNRASIRQFVDERGKTRLPKTYLITMPFDGRIEEIDLVEGDAVSADQAVARIVRSDLLDAVEEGRAVVDRLAAAIAENNDTTVEETSRQQAVEFTVAMRHAVEAAHNRMIAGKAKLDFAASAFQRAIKLRQQDVETQEEFEQAELDHVEARVDFQQDDLVLKSTEAIEAATKLLPKMILQFIQRKSLTAAVLEKERTEAEARLRQVLRRQERGTMTSPVDGIVLERLASNERQLAAGTILMKIGRPDDLEIETDVLSQDVVDVKKGDPVEIYGPAVGRRADDGVHGFVYRIHPAGFTKVSSLGVEQQRVRVVIRFAPGVLGELRPERQLGVDYRLRVRIFTAEKKDVLTMPRSALFRGADDQWQVFAVRGGRAVLKKIEVGLMNDRTVEVTGGLDETDVVILAPETSLADGARVRPVLRP